MCENTFTPSECITNNLHKHITSKPLAQRFFFSHPSNHAKRVCQQTKQIPAGSKQQKKAMKHILRLSAAALVLLTGTMEASAQATATATATATIVTPIALTK